MTNIMISVESGDHSMNQINDDSMISQGHEQVDLQVQFQDPISVQKAVHPSKTKFGLLLKLEES